MIAALLPLIGFAAFVGTSEAGVTLAGQRVIALDLARARGDEATVAQIAAMTPPAANVPRGQLANAVADAYAAVDLAEASRPALLIRAEREIDAALAARPNWGEAWAVKAYVQMLAKGQSSGAADNALARSYAEAPYLRSVADWRIRYGMIRWPNLDPALRVRILDEACWLASVDGGKRAQLFAMARETLAYNAFMLRWRSLRSEGRYE